MVDGDPQATARRALEERLALMHRILRFVDDRWAAKRSVAELYRMPKPLPTKWGVGRYLLWAAGLAIVLTMVATPILQAIAQSDAAAHGSIFYPTIEALNVAVLMTPVALIVAAGVVLLWNKLALPRLIVRAQRTNQQREAHNASVWAQEQQINAQLVQAGLDFTRHVGADFFPQAYLQEDVVLFCIQAVRDHRATTVGEAINLYETHAMHLEQIAASERVRKQVAIGTVINAAMTGAAIGTMRSEGKATRAANAANARANAASAREIREQLKKPVNVNVRFR